MIPRNCQVKHNPPETHGDCIRACVASIIERDDVPHYFVDDNYERANFNLRQWLNLQGFFMFCMASVDDPRSVMKEINPNIDYILLCQSGGNDHAIVCKNDEVIHNPAWYRQAIDGPHSEGVWIMLFIGRKI